MELAVIFLIWLAVTALDNMSKRKKRRLPPPQNQDDSQNFDIPTIANDPNFPGEEIPIFIENPRQVEVRPKDFQPARRKNFSERIREQEETCELNLNLTPSTVMEGFVLSELLGKPKALRKIHPRKC